MKVTKSKIDTTNKSQEVSPFPAGDHKEQLNRRTRRHNKCKTETYINDPQNTAFERSVKIFTGGLKKQFHGAKLTLNLDVSQET